MDTAAFIFVLSLVLFLPIISGILVFCFIINLYYHFKSKRATNNTKSSSQIKVGDYVNILSLNKVGVVTSIINKPPYYDYADNITDSKYTNYYLVKYSHPIDFSDTDSWFVHTELTPYSQ